MCLAIKMDMSLLMLKNGWKSDKLSLAEKWKEGWGRGWERLDGHQHCEIIVIMTTTCTLTKTGSSWNWRLLLSPKRVTELSQNSYPTCKIFSLTHKLRWTPNLKTESKNLNKNLTISTNFQWEAGRNLDCLLQLNPVAWILTSISKWKSVSHSQMALGYDEVFPLAKQGWY